MIGIGHWRYRRFHVSYLLGWLALGILVGLLGAKLTQPTFNLLGVALCVLLVLPSLRSRRWWVVGIVFALGTLVGLARGSSYMAEIVGYDTLVGKSVILSGKIATDPQDSGKGVTAFHLSDIGVDGSSLPGEVYVSVAHGEELKRGDAVEVSGKLKDGFATYHASISYGHIVSTSRSPDVIREVRERFVESVRSHVAEPMASLGIGFVVGQRSALPPDLDEQLKIVGLTHIVVASGYNLTILVRFARRLLARRSRYLAFVLSASLMLVFVAFSGLSPSMNRAVAVTGLSLLAWYYGRRFHPLLLIGYVAAGTALWNPVYVWSDVGWYLSFFAFSGVLILAPLIVAALFKKARPPAVAQLVIETLSAELMTLPLIAFIFGTFPVFGLIANVLVGPIIPFAMVATAVAGAVGIALPFFASLCALPASIIIGYVVSVVEWLSGVEWAQFEAGISLPLTIAWFVFVVATAIFIWRRTEYNFRSSAITD